MIRRPPRSPLFPYTPLSRSLAQGLGLALTSPAAAQSFTYNPRPPRPKPPPAPNDGQMLVQAVEVDYDYNNQRVSAVGNVQMLDRKSTRLNSSHSQISYAVFC